MINAHSELPRVGDDPFEETEDYTSRFAANQNEGILTLLRGIESNIERIGNYSPRQLNKEAPTCIDLGPLSGQPGAGTAAGAVYATTQRFRVTYIVMGGGVALDNFRLKLGSRPFNFFGTGSLETIPFEVEIDRGTDINVADITTPANVAWTFMIFGYPE